MRNEAGMQKEIKQAVEDCGGLDCRFSRFEGSDWICLKCNKMIDAARDRQAAVLQVRTWQQGQVAEVSGPFSFSS